MISWVNRTHENFYLIRSFLASWDSVLIPFRIYNSCYQRKEMETEGFPYTSNWNILIYWEFFSLHCLRFSSRTVFFAEYPSFSPLLRFQAHPVLRMLVHWSLPPLQCLCSPGELHLGGKTSAPAVILATVLVPLRIWWGFFIDFLQLRATKFESRQYTMIVSFSTGVITCNYVNMKI